MMLKEVKKVNVQFDQAVLATILKPKFELFEETYGKESKFGELFQTVCEKILKEMFTEDWVKESAEKLIEDVCYVDDDIISNSVEENLADRVESFMQYDLQGIVMGEIKTKLKPFFKHELKETASYAIQEWLNEEDNSEKLLTHENLHERLRETEYDQLKQAKDLEYVLDMTNKIGELIGDVNYLIDVVSKQEKKIKELEKAPWWRFW